MKRVPLLIALALVAAAAGWLLTQPRHAPSPHPAAKIETAAPVPERAAPPPEPAPAPKEDASPPATTPPEPGPAVAPGPPAAVAEGVRLREEAQHLLSKIRIREALELFKQAVRTDPSAENHAAYGRVLRDLTAMNGALYHLRAAAEADPGNADRWIELANAYYLKPDPGLAWEAERRAREAEPGIRLRRERGKIVRESDSAAPAE